MLFKSERSMEESAARSATWTVGSRLARFFCEILASEGWGVEELEQVAFRILQFLVGDSDHAVLVMYLRRSRPKTERRNGLYITRPSLLRATCRLLLRRHTARLVQESYPLSDGHASRRQIIPPRGTRHSCTYVYVYMYIYIYVYFNMPIYMHIYTYECCIYI